MSKSPAAIASIALTAALLSGAAALESRDARIARIF
jgi:hypothetical protein